ncbi:MFS transporter [Ktedonosporobacter rubrisoli]|uniref:MFS transporter n=1 Tax=Ktedonosporobacter rubrisoli TaxID=2509675 RepID=A0A4P6JMI3_KTERU|nr:MFS transporter [Ktedonosporobacter rubrisoli]QBD76478.1 MFS transporter [Ktedonosporobacter rubrisoli]
MKRLWWALLTFTLGTNLSSPLYPLYQTKFHMSAADISLLYLVYALFLVPSLLLLGPLADRLGRKALIIPSILLMVVATGFFAFATQPWQLFVGRGFQGLAIGGFLGSCTALMLEQTDPKNYRFAVVLASFTTMVGMGLGPGLAGVLIQYVPLNPFQFPFLLHILLLLLDLIAVLSVKETFQASLQQRFQIALGVPQQVRRPFWSLIAPTSFFMYAFSGTAFALIPTFVVSILNIHNLAMSGVLLFLLMLIGGIAQLLVARVDLFVINNWGVILTVIGAFVLVSAAPTHSPLVLFLGMMIEGCGSGFLYKGSFGLAGQISTHKQRSQIVSSYYVAGYSGLIITVLLVGRLTSAIGLTYAFLCLAIALTLLGCVILFAARQIKATIS